MTDQREHLGLYDAGRAQVQDSAARALYIGLGQKSLARSKKLHRMAPRQQQQIQRAAQGSVIVYDVEVWACGAKGGGWGIYNLRQVSRLLQGDFDVCFGPK